MNNVEKIAAKDEKISLIFENERAAGILREMMLCCSGFIFVEIKKADAWSWKTGAHKISRKKLNEKSYRGCYRSVVALEHATCSQRVLGKCQARPVYGSKTIPFLCGRERMRKFDQTREEIE